MMPHGTTAVPAGGQPPAKLRNSSAALQRIASLIGRALQFGVVAAAGFGGWLAVEQYAFPSVAGVVVAQAQPGLWPAEISKPTTTWDSFSLTYQGASGPTHTTSTDGSTGRTRITYFDNGIATSDVEIAGYEAWERAAGSPDWVRVVDQNVPVHIQLGLGDVEPIHVSTLISDVAEPFVTVTQQPSEISAMRFLVQIDVAAFRNAEPVEFPRWASHLELSEVRKFSDVQPIQWTIDVREDGYIVRTEGRIDDIEVWSDYPPELIFESPLQPRPGG
jgi:hypothetical protein